MVVATLFAFIAMAYDGAPNMVYTNDHSRLMTQSGGALILLLTKVRKGIE